MRWESTPTWNFPHRPLRDIDALLEDMAEYESMDQEITEEIAAIAATHLSDQAAQRRLKYLLKEAVVF